MDSANSGSMQSSSGGDEEYESRAHSITAAFMNNPPSHVGPMAASFQAHAHHHPQSSAMFDPLSNLFDPLSTRSSLPLTSPNPLLNLDMVWSRNPRSDQTPVDLGGLAPNSSAANQSLTQLSSFSAVQNIPQPPESNALRGSALGPNQTDQNINNSGGGNPNVVRNSKKRPRASRRAPTTVLTTDTTNFRAMVQEFTGIPAPPFTASSSFPRNSRFDLFGTAVSTIRSATHLDGPSPQPYLLRPFPQKAPLLSPPASTPPSTNDLGLLKHPSNFLNTNMQNPVFNIQNMFQSNPKYPSSNSAITGSNKQQGLSNLEIPQNDQNLKMGILEELGLSHGHAGTQLSGLPTADETLSSTRDNNSNPPSASWVGDGAESEQGLNLRSANGTNYSNSERVSNGKLRYSATANSSEFLVDKAAENATARSEGMVESWICSD